MIQGQNLVARKNFKFSFFIIFEKYYEISIFIFVGYKEKKKEEKSQSQCIKNRWNKSNSPQFDKRIKANGT